MRTLRVLIAIGIGVALADASIVTLALPELLIDLDTGVEGVAAVIGVYTLALALALPLAALARRAVSDPVLGAVGLRGLRRRRRVLRGRGHADLDARLPHAAGARRGGGARRRLRAARAAAGCGSPRPSSGPRSARRSAAR